MKVKSGRWYEFKENCVLFCRSDSDWQDAIREVKVKPVKPKFRLEVGGYYKNRNGDVVGPVELYDNHEWPNHIYRVILKDAGNCFLTKKGKWKPDGKSNDELDLIERVDLPVQDDGWIEWNGKECPVPLNFFVDVKLRIGYMGLEIPSGALRWIHTGNDDDIIAYRLSKQK